MMPLLHPFRLFYLQLFHLKGNPFNICLAVAQLEKCDNFKIFSMEVITVITSMANSMSCMIIFGLLAAIDPPSDRSIHLENLCKSNFAECFYLHHVHVYLDAHTVKLSIPFLKCAFRIYDVKRMI